MKRLVEGDPGRFARIHLLRRLAREIRNARFASRPWMPSAGLQGPEVSRPDDPAAGGRRRGGTGHRRTLPPARRRRWIPAGQAGSPAGHPQPVATRTRASIVVQLPPGGRRGPRTSSSEVLTRCGGMAGWLRNRVLEALAGSRGPKVLDGHSSDHRAPSESKIPAHPCHHDAR